MSKFIDRTGETNISTCGVKMTIIAYRNHKDIDIQFEDGTVVQHKDYHAFTKGNIGYPYKKKLHCIDKRTRINRIGETNTNTKGILMSIVAYRNKDDIDIQFSNNIIVKHKRYSDFKKGMINQPSQKYNNKAIDRIGETVIRKDGISMTIINYKNYTDIDVKLSTGLIIKSATYSQFKKCSLGLPRIPYTQTPLPTAFRIGETKRNNQNEQMTIIAYESSDNITIKFDNGVIKQTCYSNFKKGTITSRTNPTDKIGETTIAHNGLKATIIDYVPNHGFTIQFEDNIIIKNKPYHNFKIKSLKHPTLQTYRNGVTGTLFGINISNIAYTINNTTNYFCECPVCGHKDIWNVAEIKEHSETCHTDQRKEITACKSKS